MNQSSFVIDWDRKIEGKLFNELRQPCVYGWFRDDECLYIGMTTKGFFQRFQIHAVVGIFDKVLEKDEIRFILCSTPEETQRIEAELISSIKPLFNDLPRYREHRRQKDKTTKKSRAPILTPLERNCKNCGDKYLPYRSWQEFCKPRCRNIFYWKNHNTIQMDGEPVVVPAIEAVPIITTNP